MMVSEVLRRLREKYPHGGALEIGMPFHMLVLVMLSARTRDEQVLKLAPALFVAFPSPQAMATASVEEIAAKISSIGLFRQKAKNLKVLAQKLVDDFDGRVPSTIEELTTLPGVGRKTASVVLVGAFGKSAVAVDVHVQRIAQRLGWTKEEEPVEIERDLLVLVPPEEQAVVNQTFVPFGRAVCTTGTPRCWACPVADLCAYAQKNLTPPNNADEILAENARKEAELERLKQEAAKRI